MITRLWPVLLFLLIFAQTAFIECSFAFWTWDREIRVKIMVFWSIMTAILAFVERYNKAGK